MWSIVGVGIGGVQGVKELGTYYQQMGPTYASGVASGEELRNHGGQRAVREIRHDPGRSAGNGAGLRLHSLPQHKQGEDRSHEKEL